MKARKPGAFVTIGRLWLAECITFDNERRISVGGYGGCLMHPSDNKKFAAWLTKAAAWCRDGGK